MSTPIAINWGAFAADPALTAATVAAAGFGAGTAVALGGAAAADVEVSVTVTYGATVAGGPAVVYLCGDVDGTNFESPATDAPFALAMPVPIAGTAQHKRFVVSAEAFGRLQVQVGNPAGNSSITVTVRTRSASETAG